jgi:hypothetical protein
LSAGDDVVFSFSPQFQLVVWEDSEPVCYLMGCEKRCDVLEGEAEEMEEKSGGKDRVVLQTMVFHSDMGIATTT